MIYSQRSDGLGTRILSAIYARLLSEQVGVPMGVIWTPLGWPFLVRDTPLMHPRHLPEIFASLHLFRDAAEGAHGEIVPHEEVVSTELFSLYYNRDELSGLSRGEVAQIAMMGRGVNYDFPGPLFDFMDRDPTRKAAVSRIAATINWSPAVAAAIAEIDGRFQLGRCLSVHVRRGDILEMLFAYDLDDLASDGMTQILQRYTPLQAYFEAIDAAGPDAGGIVVCTEDDGVVERFVARYGPDRVASCAGMTLTDNQRAAVDLILLSRSRRIIAPVLSFFSQCAAEIGGTVLQNTAWHLRETTGEIDAILAASTAERVGAVRAILYRAAHRLSAQNELGLEGYYEDLMRAAPGTDRHEP